MFPRNPFFQNPVYCPEKCLCTHVENSITKPRSRFEDDNLLSECLVNGTETYNSISAAKHHRCLRIPLTQCKRSGSFASRVNTRISSLYMYVTKNSGVRPNPLEPPCLRACLTMLLEKFELKCKKFCSFVSGIVNIEFMWNKLLAADSTLRKGVSVSRVSLPNLAAFLQNCCICRKNHSKSLKERGFKTCVLLKPVRLPEEVFDSLQFLPIPISGENGPYKPTWMTCSNRNN